MAQLTCGLAMGVLAFTVAMPRPAVAARDAQAASGGPPPTSAARASPEDELAEIVVTAHKLTEELWRKNTELDESRDQNLLPRLGATEYGIDQAALQVLPQGKNTPLDKVLLQIPGVSYDSAISNPDFHVRNEYANVQYRINGIQLPDGVSALGSILETGFVGSLNLRDGALPAQYGLRTAGVIDITSKTEFDPGGDIDLYAGSWQTVSPSVEYGDGVGPTQYFLTARYLSTNQGLENATPMANPIHDRSTQQKFFGYGSTLFGDSSRLSYMAGGFVGHFQIPDVEGEESPGDLGSPIVSSTSLNENETDRFFFGVVALQTHEQDVDLQISLFTRYATVDFVPDVDGDLAFFDVAANVVRKSLLDGLEFDMADRLTAAHTLRAGLTTSVEKTQVQDRSLVLALDTDGNPLPTPISINDYTSKTGWTAGAYVQDEWRIRDDLTLNTGLRFDQMNQFVSAHQLSPRIALNYTPVADTTVHAGVSRYFTPPMQAQATPNNLRLFQNTTQQPAIALADPVRPERATYFDVGVDRQLSPEISAGLDAYYKRSTDTLDDGQFGQAVVLEEYNFADGFSRGVEFKIKYERGGLHAYANLSHEISMVKTVVSNQYLIGDPLALAYLSSRYNYPSDAQTVTASAGVAYRWRNLLASIDGIYGSGLRAGFANEQHSPAYTQWNAALAANFDPWRNRKMLALRLSVINLFDRSYLLRDATGIGEFAPQYGPRRGSFMELTQQF